ncbi:two-component system LytT family response regulator [Sporomusaceae bacterium BoRhaA]|uniref:LytR/AlgR family response regulator transcription factor n=1 Tax=Pelorhabdus rhamnosifermentans TaxID=2772457 RepID=UPI001C0622AC|nr:LytTR family DNA-binding domain-containing protein [Pelorhabdus rhamnosifermentans]MBU2703329.1 two-component system LytT family response regulator [Pelorhabdus rhamnosifermentans]
MLKVIIADDNFFMRQVLKDVLVEIPEVDIISEAEDGQQVVQLVEELDPEVVFLDIDMPGKNGIKVAKEILDINSKIFIIFVTGYSCYTHEAFEVYAFDYLVKPVDKGRVRRTINQIKIFTRERIQTGLLKRAKSLLQGEHSKLKVLSNEKSIFVNISDIIFVTRSERKTIIYVVGGSVIQTNEPLQSLEKRLEHYQFFRCHKGFIINPSMVLEIFPWGNKTYLVKLANTKETALMTVEHVREFQKQYCI